MRIRTAIAAAALGATALLGATAGTAVSDDPPKGHAAKSPEVLSDENVRFPVNVPVNVCGNPIVGLLSSPSKSDCANK
jgi:hypothetical protein